MGIGKVVYDWDLKAMLADVPRSDRPDTLDEIGQYLVEAILSDVGEAKSPVTGRAFPKLSAAYKKIKAHESSADIANLELTGEMLDSLTYKVVGSRVQIGIWGDQAPKADGHNNFSGDSKLPRRAFIPDKDRGESFRPDIRDEVQTIIDEAIDSGNVRTE